MSFLFLIFREVLIFLLEDSLSFREVPIFQLEESLYKPILYPSYFFLEKRINKNLFSSKLT